AVDGGQGTLARWNGTRWELVPDGPVGAIEAMTQHGSDLWVGGWFTRTATRQAEGLARWSPAPTPAPRAHAIFQAAWPIPARDRLSVRFRLARAGRVTLRLLDIRGAKVAEVLDETLAIGTFERAWTLPGGARRLPPGVYLARI